MHAFLQAVQIMFQPNDFTIPVVALVILIGLSLFGLFILKDIKRKQKIVEQQKIAQLSKESQNSQDLTTLAFLLASLGIKNK